MHTWIRPQSRITALDPKQRKPSHFHKNKKKHKKGIMKSTSDITNLRTQAEQESQSQLEYYPF